MLYDMKYEWYNGQHKYCNKTWHAQYRYSSHYNSKHYNQYILLKNFQPAHVKMKFIKNLFKKLQILLASIPSIVFNRNALAQIFDKKCQLHQYMTTHSVTIYSLANESLIMYAPAIKFPPLHRALRKCRHHLVHPGHDTQLFPLDQICDWKR